MKASNGQRLPTSRSKPSALRALGVGVEFQGLRALIDVDISVDQGEILGLIGPNGAGKTTLLNVLSGFQRPAAGRIELDGADLGRLDQHQVARIGIGRTFQAARLFPDLTVFENVEVAALGAGRGVSVARSRAAEVLEYLGLSSRQEVSASAVTYGEARLVGIARALALDPKFLLLDEPAAGMSPEEALHLMDQIARIRTDFGCGIVLIEHNMQMVMNVCERVQVLARGSTIANGTPAEVQSSDSVREAYLGHSIVQSFASPMTQRTRSSEIVLSVESLVVKYGMVQAVASVSLNVKKGEFVAVIGPNGAGKSTLLSSIAGLVKPAQGKISFNGALIDRMSVTERVKAGIALVPEGRRVLSTLSVRENLQLGQTVIRDRREAARRLEFVLETFPVLRTRLDSYAGQLSGGEQQQLVIARALQSNPQVLLLDEPSLGLAPLIIDKVYETLAMLNRNGLTILLMEQNANRALSASDRAYVMRHGTIELEGEASAILEGAALDKAYFGFDTANSEAAQ